MARRRQTSSPAPIAGRDTESLCGLIRATLRTGVRAASLLTDDGVAPIVDVLVPPSEDDTNRGGRRALRAEAVIRNAIERIGGNEATALTVLFALAPGAISNLTSRRAKAAENSPSRDGGLQVRALDGGDPTMSEWSVPGYTELRELGSGSQSRVVLARHDELGTIVAIKYLPAGLMENREETALFRWEAQILARVRNANVARLFDYVEIPECGAAIVMEAVGGVTLRTMLDCRSFFTPQATLAMLKDSLLGLAAAHVTGVVHGDYKPANIVVGLGGRSRLIDFGVAVLSGDRSRAGTPAYMAPEQWLGASASPATDVYAATCVTYECVTGRRPFREGDETTTMETRHLKAPIPVRDVPRPLRELISKGMAKDPADRPSNADAFVRELEASVVGAYGRTKKRRFRQRLMLEA